MLKHRLTPDRRRKDSDSTSLGSGSSESIDSNLEEEHEKTARLVWDRHTNPASELSMAKRRLADRETIIKSKSEPSAGLAPVGIKRLEEAAPKHSVKKNVEKEDVYQDMEKATDYTNIEGKKHQAMKKSTVYTRIEGKKQTDHTKKIFGLNKNQWLVVGMLGLVCLILYSVLLHLAMKAAQCQNTLENIMKQRKEWEKKVMEVTYRDKSNS